MLTMTRLPSDSFLPSGGMYDHHEHSGFYRASDVSPLALPGAQHQQYFDNLAHRIAPNTSSIQLPPYSRSPRLSPPVSDLDKRTRSLSPSASAASNASLPTSSDHNIDASAFSLQLRRLTLQNRRLLENWDAERKHIEANRLRAEEVDREEREIMDEERELWMQQKSALESKIIELDQRAQLAETQRDTLAHQLEFLSKQARASPRASSPCNNPHATSQSNNRSASLSPSAGTTSIRFLDPKDGISPLTGRPFAGTGITMPESSPFIPLDPRMQGPSPGSGSPTECPAQLPSIDVSEVVPQLEGIRLKQPTIEKPTFAVDEPVSSSPPADEAGSPRATSPSGSPGNKDRASPVERAKEVLRSTEASRLTMHAGHTPSHSMSFSKLPTLMSTASGNTAGSSGAVTPNEDVLEIVPPSDHGMGKHTSQAVEIVPSHDEDGQAVSEEPTANFEPSEGDRPLSGQTHLMNRPAVDEPFLQLLSEKLQSADPTPTVLLNVASQEAETEAAQQPVAPAPTGNDGAADESDSAEQIDEDIPLKLKGGSNFGLPYGNLGSLGNC
ncbi:plasmalemma vesicle-associated protein [Microdochium nivale]|nr:plasmalemma vesicle-associated protein [Microdochium nivale]